jgi:hypothetical protein
MDEQVKQIFAKVRTTASFQGMKFPGVDACNADGDNALHCVVTWGDLHAAKTLIDAGIDVNKAGDLGYTPLHNACIRGNLEMVKLLVASGADLFALSDGDLPFTNARLGGHDIVCDFLKPLMEQARLEDPRVWLRARIARLRRELDALEAKLGKQLDS